MNDEPLFVNGFLTLNIALSVGILFVCLCRSAVMTAETTRRAFRLRYVVIAVAALGNLASPWFFREQPGPGAVMLAGALLWHLCASVGQWRNGVPPDGRTTPGDLYEMKP